MFVEDAFDLKKLDGFGVNGRSDPYVKVVGVRDDEDADKNDETIRITKYTRVIKNRVDATWNELLSFECGKWLNVDVSVWDKDTIRSDKRLISIGTFSVCEPGTFSFTHSEGKSRVNFKIILIPDRNDCTINPCFHAGRCVTAQCGYSPCSCRHGYAGFLCEKNVGGGGGRRGGTTGGGTAGGAGGDGSQSLLGNSVEEQLFRPAR